MVTDNANLVAVGKAMTYREIKSPMKKITILLLYWYCYLNTIVFRYFVLSELFILLILHTNCLSRFLYQLSQYFYFFSSLII